MFLVLGAILFAAFKLLPPYINNYEMQDFLNGLTRNATYARETDDTLRKEVLDQARQLDIPLQPDQIQIEQNGPTVNIGIHYMVTVDLLVRKLDLDFAPNAGNRNILAKP